MVRKCSACGKTNVRYPNENFYRFPLDPQKRAKWISLIGLKENEIKQLSPCSVLCSDHFNTKDIATKQNGERFIMPEAIPIFYSRKVRTLRRRTQAPQTLEESSGSQQSEHSNTIKTEDIESKIEVEDTILHEEHRSVKEERLSDEEETEINTFDDPLINFVKMECKPEIYEEECQNTVQFCNPTDTHSKNTEKEKKPTIAELLISGIAHKYQHCGFKTNDRWALLKHIHETHIEAIRKCEYCDFRSKSPEELKIHVESVHVSSKLLKCKICDYSCFYSFSLKAHFETVHLKRKDEECHYCETSCASKSDPKYRIGGK